MLKPYICVACEKIIIDKGDVASLIGLFNRIIANIPAGASEVPKNAVAPKEWAIFSSWDTEVGDEQKKYFLCTQVLYPDKTRFAEVSKVRMNIEPDKRTQVTVNLLGFPMGQPGKYTVQTWVEENEKVVVDPIEFTIMLEIIRQDQGNP